MKTRGQCFFKIVAAAAIIFCFHGQSLAGQTFQTEDQKMDSVLSASENLQKKLDDLTTENSSLKDAHASDLKELKNAKDREAELSLQLAQVQATQKKFEEFSMKAQSGVSPENYSSVMFTWLLSHQNKNTGLVASFEGDSDIEDVAFTYDQSLATQAMLIYGETESAKAVLEFFYKKAKWEGDLLYNAYETIGGSPSEFIVHTGPSLWMGIAALQYEQLTQDASFRPMAERIAQAVMEIQDGEGGVRGGPTLFWQSTEHNLDAYTFFGMLYKITGKEKYSKAQQNVLSWIKKYAYSVRDSRINRGKGDATIATDTFSWAIASIGPEKLKEIGFDPEGIMDYAEKNCEVTVQNRQSLSQSPEVRGFDFSKAQNLGRGGVISTEWTAQMVVSYQTLSKYFEKNGNSEKADHYRQKADFYLTELQKLLVTSPSRMGQGYASLPYASIDNVNTGHGWRTPKGVSTGSVSATAYALFAWKGYNPLELLEPKGQ